MVATSSAFDARFVCPSATVTSAFTRTGLAQPIGSHASEECPLPVRFGMVVTAANLRIGLRKGNWVVSNPGDAVAEFADSAGRRKIAVANPVYLLAPRFLTFYQVHGLGRVRSELSLRPVSSPIGREIIGQRQTTSDTRARTEVERLQSQSGVAGEPESDSEPACGRQSGTCRHQAGYPESPGCERTTDDGVGYAPAMRPLRRSATPARFACKNGHPHRQPAAVKS
jgi:hypothetical protein